MVSKAADKSNKVSRFQGFITLFAPGGYKAKVTFTYTFLRKYIHANNTIYKTKHSKAW